MLIIILLGLIVLLIIIALVSSATRSTAQFVIHCAEQRVAQLADNQRMSGKCPYCASIIEATAPVYDGSQFIQPPGFDCPSCARRVAVAKTAEYPFYEFTQR